MDLHLDLTDKIMEWTVRNSLYDREREHDACGVGMLVNIRGDKSHELVDYALKVLENMKHRGAEGADNKTGDGAGIMLQIPHEFILLQGIPVPEKGKYGTGLVFLPKDGKRQAQILSIIIEETEREGLSLMHLRSVPVNSGILGKDALGSEPDIKQIFITGYVPGENLELKGLTREAFCAPLYENSEYWGMIERGEQSISLVKLLQVCEVYHIPIEDLIDLNYSPQRDAEVKADIASLLEHCHGKQLEVIRKFIEDIALAL